MKGGYWYHRMGASTAQMYNSGQGHKGTISNIFLHTSKADSKMLRGEQDLYQQITSRINKTLNESTILGQLTNRDNNSSTLVNVTLDMFKRREGKLSQAYDKISKLEDFYQIMCSGDYANMGIRCFQHNNQLILYCVKDQKLLCPNCMYSNNKPIESQEKLQKNKKNTKSDQKQADQQKNTQIQKSKSQTKSLSKSQKKRKQKLKNGSSDEPATKSKDGHSKHQVKQTTKSTVEILGDIKVWQTQMQQKVTAMGQCQGAYQKLRQAFQKSKNTIIGQLDSQYDKQMMQLSKRYSEHKKLITDMTDPIQSQLQKIINIYKQIKRLMIPNRYPIPVVKHCWLEQMKRIVQAEISTNAQEINNNWLKNYESQCRAIVAKFGRKKNLSNANQV